jgi:hypothetical protein
MRTVRFVGAVDGGARPLELMISTRIAYAKLIV